MIEAVRLQIDVLDRDFGQRGFRQDVLGDVLDPRTAISWMKLILLYSPEATRETTSRRVISGSTMASRPRRP